ncbi:DUF6401 family natural product biosynthesis protein [Streptomyces sp. NPDC059506]|uniref:Uncharacterized protein n=1 Tax=Streptomyces thermolineatus TaxID=44033 RepID=A0ABN3M3B8_9ACTN|nr:MULTISPECIES: DUF6401 family natural product biosynthesis protein [unclassified Streptomyces]MCZ2526395.1 DUF6401 family natural product biosynthesis protein [Streptomyces sp. HB2AG]PLW73978.1 hypothetical protein C0036_04365 [Streptomyces sp. DJ]QMV24516.1 hypothetical protein GQS52_25155 [Streptomyces sp. SCUT-3]
MSHYSLDPLAWATAAYGPGLRRLLDEPGLVAAVDQHAAAVRDSIEMDRETLGDYLLGFLDELHDQGWDHDLPDDSFPSLRVLSVCWLARENGYLPADDTHA